MKSHDNNYYLRKAQKNMPNIIKRNIIPPYKTTILNAGEDLLIDLGNHYVGYFSFNMGYTDCYIDAPVRISVKFYETKSEINYDFSSYNGTLCASWLQEEILTIDNPGPFEMPRRYAARYIKITIMHTPKEIKLSNFCFTAVTSANISNLKNPDIKNAELKKIDSIAVNTLKNCMHFVFEDGPKRDRRLWIGDLRLEALANYYTFNNLKLVKRCLYLFASATPNNKGFLPGYIYETPNFVSGEWFLEDYALLFVVSLCDYYNHTSDYKTFLDLYPVAKSQMEAANSVLDKDGIITIGDGCDAFIDWCQDLKKTTALHGIYLYTLNSLTSTLKKIGHSDYTLFKNRLDKATESAKKILCNTEDNLFTNERDYLQKSVHSIVWMILGNVISGEKAWEILLETIESKDSLKPVTPYMHHYVVEAILKLGKTTEGFSYIKNYWGKMAKENTDTFYEVFVPENPDISPYRDKMMNSMCHAWSCSPSYFIRCNKL